MSLLFNPTVVTGMQRSPFVYMPSKILSLVLIITSEPWTLSRNTLKHASSNTFPTIAFFSSLFTLSPSPGTPLVYIKMLMVRPYTYPSPYASPFFISHSLSLDTSREIHLSSCDHTRYHVASCSPFSSHTPSFLWRTQRYQAPPTATSASHPFSSFLDVSSVRHEEGRPFFLKHGVSLSPLSHLLLFPPLPLQNQSV